MPQRELIARRNMILATTELGSGSGLGGEVVGLSKVSPEAPKNDTHWD